VLAFGRHDRWPIVALLAWLLLGSLGLVGHAVMRAGALGWLNRLSHVIHLLAAGFWLGSLVPLIACLRSMTDPAISTNASVALRRFSGLGHVAVATVLATGVINTWLVLRAIADQLLITLPSDAPCEDLLGRDHARFGAH